MIMTVKMRGRTMPLMAPIGAAAYIERDTAGGAELLFAMMRTGESGLDTLLRLRKEHPDLPWKPVTARPEHQLNAGDANGEFKKFDFTYKDGTFFGATDAIQGYLDTIIRMQQLPRKAPPELTVTLADWEGKGGKTKPN